MRSSVARIARADSAGAISVECVSQENAAADEYKQYRHDLGHHFAPTLAMPEREVLRNSR
jgi:hypothetical protein